MIFDFLKTTLVASIALILSSACSTLPMQETPPAATELRIMSWNIKKLGRKNLDYASAVAMLKEGDVIALQEVNASNGKQALETLSLMLEKEIGERTCEGITEVTDGPGPERYAFIWINSKVSLIKEDGEEVADCPLNATSVSLNKTHHEKIDREPGQAVFRTKTSKVKFTLTNVHLVPTAKKPANEVPWLFDSVKNIEGIVIVVGDLNLGSANKAFDHARQLGFTASLDNENTSLKSSQRLLNLPYDNIWVRGTKVTKSKVINLFERFESIGQKEIYNNISDHSPITTVVGF